MPFHQKEQRGHYKSHKPLSSSTNTRETLIKKHKNSLKKDNGSSTQSDISINHSITTARIKPQKQQSQKQKQSNYDKYYDKYYKRQREKEFPNISIIEERESILSNNLENSLDSLNNFISQGNRHENSVLEKSNEGSSYEQVTEDWTLLQNQYQQILEDNVSFNQQAEYLQIISQLKDKKIQSYDDVTSPVVNVSQQIRTLHQQISKLKELRKRKQKNEQSSQVLQNMGQGLSYNQQKSSTFNQKSLQFKNSNEILRKSQAVSSRQQIHSNLLKLRIKISEDGSKKDLTSDRLLQHLSEEQNKFPEQQGPSATYQQTQKDQEQFMKFMDKKYYEQNQPNLSLNNISKIMGVRPKELNNKSIQNQNQNEIKQKEDDEVVAMLENELRGNQIPEIPQTDQNQILLKQSRDNLCLNQLEGDIQNNIQATEIQQDVSDENKNIFFALQARQKWIKSLEKDQKWKNAQLAFLSKMKKILHNPYIEFPEE